MASRKSGGQSSTDVTVAKITRTQTLVVAAITSITSILVTLIGVWAASPNSISTQSEAKKAAVVQGISQQFKSSVAKARNVWIMGQSLHGTIGADYSEQLEDAVKNGAQIRIIMMANRGAHLGFSGFYAVPGIPPAEQTRLIDQSLEMVAMMRTKASTSGNIQLKTIAFPLPFNAVVVDPDQDSGFMLIKQYGYLQSYLRLLIPKSDKTYWSFYWGQLEQFWRSGNGA